MEYQDNRHLLDQPDALRRSAETEGYVFLKAVLDHSLLQCALEAVADCLSANGYISSDLSAGAKVIKHPNEDYYGSGIDAEIYRKLQRLEAVHAVAQSPQLNAVMEAIIGERPLLHPNFILRTIFPDAVATPPHQDLVHTRGSENAWTCWIPLANCPRSLGGLSILARSHDTLLPTWPQSNGGRETILSEDMPQDWVSGDLEQGDIIIFHGRTVHRAMPNASRDYLRISMDCRFQPPADPIQKITLQPHGALQNWDEIYSGWTRRDLQWHWRKYDLNTLDETSATKG